MNPDILDDIVDTVQLLDPMIVLDDKLLNSFTDDIARKIHDYDVIASRYGMSMEQMYRLIKIPAVTKQIKTKRAIYNSDDNAKDRVAQIWGEGLVMAAPMQIATMMDPMTPHAVRVEMMKIASRLAGIEGSGKSAVEGGAAPGTRFSVSFNFTGANRKEQFGVEPQITIEGDAA